MRRASDDQKRRLRLAIVCDLAEENWASMDLVAEMLLKNLRLGHADILRATRIRPRMRRRFGRLPMLSKARPAFNVDFLLNRFVDYPRWLRRKESRFDLFHLVDHSYAQLVHELSPDRTIVTCHDLDSFRCLLEPARDRRSRFFKAMTERILSWFRKAARVTCDTAATRDELLAYGLLPPEHVVVVHNGVHPTCSPDPDPSADAEASRLLGPPHPDAIDLLHVGSTIPRKRIDVLLRVFASLREEFPRARLVRVGGAFTAAQLKLIERFDLSRHIVVMPFLKRPVLAAVYRRAALVLQPSDGEGFGLPVVEAMACGTPVVASDLPVLREVGGREAIFCPVGDVTVWSGAVAELLRERRERPDRWSARRSRAVAHAAPFSWAQYAGKMVSLYREVLAL